MFVEGIWTYCWFFHELIGKIWTIRSLWLAKAIPSQKKCDPEMGSLYTAVFACCLLRQQQLTKHVTRTAVTIM